MGEQLDAIRQFGEAFRDVSNQPIIEQRNGNHYRITVKKGELTRISFRTIDGVKDFQEAVKEANEFLNGKQD